MLNSLPIINGNFVFTFSYKKRWNSNTCRKFLKDCKSGCGLKCFLFRNASKLYLFIFKKLFLKLTYQNDLKIYIKK